MTTNLISRYFWLINTIQENRLTFEEISKKWGHSSLNDDKTNLPKRTFERHKSAIKGLWGVKFVFHKSDNTYSIGNIDKLKSEEQINWMINSFSVLNMLQEGYKIEDRILFERIPSGGEYLTKIVEAIKLERDISFVYNKFGENKGKYIEGTPYCLKINKQRWYVLVPNEGKLKNYALDRITDFSISNNKSQMAKAFSPQEHYYHSVGIWVDEKSSVETVRIQVTGVWINLLRTLPFHHSQTERIIDDKNSIFEYRIRIDVEVVSELLKMGEDVKVLEPQSLIDMMTEKVLKMLDKYDVG